MSNSNEVALIISAVAASMATIVYSFKHVKKSNCCGSTCEQVIVDAPKTPKQENVILAPVPMRVSPPPPPIKGQPSMFSYFSRVETSV